MFNKENFFNEFKPWYKEKSKKTASVKVIQAVDFLLDSYSSDSRWKNLREVAYSFATVAHETAWTFEPIKEYRAKAGTSGRAKQDRYWSTGYYGRGYVQLTWEDNYRKAGEELGYDLVKNPNLALDKEIAFDIMTAGMHKGWFTTKKLSTYITNSKTDYVNARRIINGTDKAKEIAELANGFEAMLTSAYEDGNSTVDVVNTVEATPEEAIEKPAEEATPLSFEQPKVDAFNPASQNFSPVPSVEPTTTSGWGAWATNVKTFWTSLGVGGVSLGSIYSGLITNPNLLSILFYILVAAVVVGGITFLITLIIKSIEKRAREREAHEINLKQLELASDPKKYNVYLEKNV